MLWLSGWRVPAGVRMHSEIPTWMPDWSALSSRSYHRTCLGDVASSLFLRSCRSEAQRTSVLRATGHGVSPADACLCWMLAKADHVLYLTWTDIF